MNETVYKSQSDEILQLAKQFGIEDDFFFVTTFEKYQVQLKILSDLKETIQKEGILVTKEYVKGRKNMYFNPTIADYNRTTDSANKTAATLIRIITALGTRKNGEEPDPLLEILAGKQK